VVKVGDFGFDTELSISLMEARRVFWDNTGNIFKDRIETKKAWREFCTCLQEDYEVVGNVKNKTIFAENCLNLFNTTN